MSNNNENTSIIKPGRNGAGAALERVGFGTQEVEHRHETRGTDLAARAQAEVQASFIMAMQRPRNIEQFRVNLLEHCKRPGFAKVAEYEKPVGGKKIKGPSIRFVEAALREFGNCSSKETITYDDEMKRVVEVRIVDFETNYPQSADVMVEKTVERRSPKDGDEVLGSRINSYGDVVYRVRATEDDFANKIGAACSKKRRNLGISVLPADIVAEAMELCRKTRMNADAKDPAAARRELADAFAQLRVLPADLDAFLGHPFDQASPAELEELRGAYAALRDGEARWVDLVAFQQAQRGEIDEASKPAAAAGDKLRARIEQVRAKQKNEQPAQAQQQQQQQQQQQTAPPAPEKKAGAPAKSDGKFHKVVDVKDAPAAASAKPAPAANPQTKPQAEPAHAADYIEGNCSMCGVPIELDANANPSTARCEACASE